ncbi:hypothetical protein FOZ62_010156 [Perkinsus olseni]|uniref:DUF2330 domain-containing protein n=1 Tax=Perkinsus olseni TaxID=32597 RepID=A0A7J6R2E6_PEROL|nr:hypothetical protein FOZ62_010156 [Perkinsus olseni]
MQTIVGILCFMGLRSFAVDWEALESPRIYLKIYPQPDALPGIERSVNASGQGGVYERPFGTCPDCSCTSPAFPVAAQVSKDSALKYPGGDA